MPHPHKENGIPAGRELSVSEDMQLKFSVKTILAIVGVVAVAASAWFNIKADVSDHTRQLSAIASSLNADHDQLQKQMALTEAQTRLLERMDDKLDYVTGARRTRPEATP